MRVLLVGPGSNGKYGGGFFYAFHRRLINGFTRAGHFIYPYSDRDTADYALGVRPLGRHLANRRLIDVAHALQPGLVLLLSSDLITIDTLEELRSKVHGVRIATMSIDDIDHPKPAEQFRRLLVMSDFGFATTGGRCLARFSSIAPVAFIPNPVDTSIDDQIAYEHTRHDYDVFFAGHQPAEDRRWRLIEDLQNAMPATTRFGIFGRHQKHTLAGAAHLQALKRAKIGLNLNRRDGDLYASDRMAQLLGNGLLLATHQASGYDDVFDSEEMIFFSSASELADTLTQVLKDDKLLRRMARAGREKAIKIMNETRVAHFIIAAVFARALPADWAFQDHIFKNDAAHAENTKIKLDQVE